MAKTTAPLLSFGGRGQIGKTMVASKWRGIPYMRQYVVPANPRTAAQTQVRTLFAFLREVWKLAPTGLQAPWDAFASGRKFLGFNKIVGENVRVMNGETDCDNMIFSPGARGGLSPTGVTVVTGTTPGGVLVAGSAPTAPSGWTFDALCACAFPDQDPTGIFTGPIVYGEDTSSTYSIPLLGFAEGVVVQVGVWARWLKPDGTIAYSPSITYQATTDVT